MTTLAAMMMAMVDDRSAFSRTGLEQALQLFANVPADVVGYEAASKSLPKIRKRAEANTPSVLTKSGRNVVSETSTLVISMAQFVEIVGDLVDSLQRDASERKPADLILRDLESIAGRGRSIDVGRGAHEEAIGGHIRF